VAHHRSVLERSPSTLIGGRYVVGEAFGSGGMGTVHLGRVVGARGFSRIVAIKKLFPGFATDRAFRQMLLDEAHLAARIRHPNVVPTLDVVEAGSDLYIVMEYVHGLSLADLVARSRGEPLPVEAALGIVQAFLLGLHAAHEARGEDGAPLGIVHRDVSPQNVLVGADGVPRLIDFGIAKAATRIQVTDPGVMKGKAAYMAPEQLVNEPASRHADVFSSAVVLWELLANRPLYPNADVGSRIRSMPDEPVPPSKHRQGIDPGLDAVVLKGLAREPSHRFATAQAMAVALGYAGRPAQAVDLARWLATHAGDELEISDERVQLFEKNPPDVGTRVSFVSAEEEASAPRRRPWLAVTGVAILAALAAVAIGANASRGAAPGAMPAQATPVVAPGAATSIAVPAAAAAGSSAAIAPATGAPSTPPSAASSRPKPARSRGSGKHACDPTYTVDSTGFKHYDPACF
jgi:serine/threonine protein kinase